MGLDDVNGAHRWLVPRALRPRQTGNDPERGENDNEREGKGECGALFYCGMPQENQDTEQSGFGNERWYRNANQLFAQHRPPTNRRLNASSSYSVWSKTA
jgi:hypothetical protein